MIESISSTYTSYEETAQDWPYEGLNKVSKAVFAASSFMGTIILLSGGSRKRNICLVAPSTSPEIQLPSPIEITDPEPVTISPPEVCLNILPKPFHDPYDLLRCSKEDIRKINEIVTTMGRYSVGEIGFFSFVSYAAKFRQYENEMDSTSVEKTALHPFKFLETIFKNPSLSRYMQTIFDDFFLKVGFMNGVNKGMNREWPRGNLEPYLDSFCKRMDLSPDAIRPLIQDRAWEKIVRCLIQKDCEHVE